MKAAIPVVVASFALAGVLYSGSIASSATPIIIKDQGYVPFTDAPIYYRSENLSDPVAKLGKKLETGEAKLAWDPVRGYLPSVLKALKVPVSSQTLVFSKTSFQYPKISPETPRALYFNDDVYVGEVRNGRFLEFISFDAQQGAIFYVMDERRADRPVIERSENDCVQCHVANVTHGIPGVFVKSVYTYRSGAPATRTPVYLTGQESPLSERWGGWYVTGFYGAQTHLGNALLPKGATEDGLNRANAANLRDLSGRFDTSPYLTSYSDVVAHLVLAHQTQMHNLITLANYQTRLALYAEQKRTGKSASRLDELSEAAQRKIEAPAEQLVEYLLFTNEAPLKEPVKGTSGFAEEFAARGPRDHQGRSLRDFDLSRRIFRYPCSYLIYSDDFDGIPEPAKSYIWRRLYEVLSGKDQSPAFASLSEADRKAIYEILTATKPGFADQWRLNADNSGPGLPR